MKLVALPILALAVTGCKNQTTGHFERVAAELPAAEAAAKAVGVPALSRELAPPILEPEDNALPLLDKANEMLSQIKRPKEHLHDLMVDETEAAQRVLLGVIRQAEPAFELLAEAANKKGVDYKRNWDAERPWEMQFPQFADLRGQVQWCTAGAFVAAREGDRRRVIRELSTSLRLGEFAGSEPTLISGLVMIALDNISFRQFQNVASKQNDIGFLRELRSLLKKHEERKPLWFYYGGEVAFSLSILKLLEQGKIKDFSELAMEDSPKPYIPDGVPPDSAAKAYRTRVLQFWTTVALGLNEEKDLLEQRNFFHKLGEEVVANPDLTYRYFKAFDPLTGRFADAMLKRNASLVTLDALLAALQYKAQHGRFPKTLDDAGFTTLDPFTNEPLKIRATKETFRVWSVGNNFKDDGGEEQQALDIVARYPRR